MHPRSSILVRCRAAGVGLLLAAAGHGACLAAQTVEVRESDTTVVRLSLRDQTRLRVWHGRIDDVIGDVYDAQKNPAGRLVVLRDEAEGDVYIKPTPSVGAMPAPIKLDLKTDAGTVGVLLQPADVIGDTITLKVLPEAGTDAGAARAARDLRAARRSTATATGLATDDGAPTGAAATQLRAIKALVLAMASPDPAVRAALGTPAAATGERGLVETVALWRQTRFALTARHDAGALVGEHYELTNTGDAPIVLDEREFWRAGVLAVSVRTMNVAPGASTAVWVVRERGAGGDR